MTIDRMIERLQELRAVYGNMPVVVSKHERDSSYNLSWDCTVDSIDAGEQVIEYSRSLGSPLSGARCARIQAYDV